MVAPNPRAPEGDPNRPQPVVLNLFAHKVLVVIGLTVVALLVLTMVWYTFWVWLVAFAGVLLAVFLRGSAIGVRKLTHLPDGWSLLTVCVLLVGVTVAAFWLLAPRVGEQISAMRETLPEAMETLGEQIGQYEWGATLAGVLQDVELGEFREQLAVGAATMLANMMSAIVAVVVVVFLGIYIALNPGIYIEGTLRFFSPMRRPRLREVFHRTGKMLIWWLLARIIAMAFVGIATALGLWALGVPLSFTLGLIAGVLDFIPNVGPLLAAVPAILIAFVESPRLALYVIILYYVIQQLESYVVTPLVQERVVKLPPALTVFVQVLFFVMAGFVGLLLATPITVAGIVLVNELYIKDTLGEEDDDDESPRQRSPESRTTGRLRQQKIQRAAQNG